MTKHLFISFIFTVILFAGCKSTKRVVKTGELKNDMSSSQIIKAHKKSLFRFKTMQSKVKIQYIQGEESQSYTVNLRMQKDEVIWMSSTLGIVRAKITPDKVSYYNKLDNTYFDGDFSLISEFLGTDVDFDNIQNILLGEAIFNLDSRSFGSDIHEESYLLFPEDQDALYEIFLLLNPGHFKMDSQQLAQPFEGRMLQIDYTDYQEIGRQILPEYIRVIALENNDETIVNMEFRSVTLNSELRFPFRIPSGFEEIVFN